MTQASERPILFSGPMVRAILDGRKTVTRRIIKPQPPRDRPVAELDVCGVGWRWWPETTTNQYDDRHWPEGELGWMFCPHGKPGDRLWVRETWALTKFWPEYDDDDLIGGGDFEDWTGPIPEARPDGWDIQWHADGDWDGDDDPDERGFRWRPSIHMPRWASRITLEITGVRVERLHAISGHDAIEEGVTWAIKQTDDDPLEAFKILWDGINGKRPGHRWADDPWVWAVSFRRIDLDERTEA